MLRQRYLQDFEGHGQFKIVADLRSVSSLRSLLDDLVECERFEIRIEVGGTADRHPLRAREANPSVFGSIPAPVLCLISLRFSGSTKP
jgi:hypothetical protein